MAIDMGALDFAQDALSGSSKPAAKPDGKALEFEFADITEDPDQPRREFDQDALAELAADIRQRGVSTPISLRLDPNAEGRYIINHGHRRFRAAILAGKTSIPAHIADTHDPYGQMTENMQREDMKPHEIAEFIKKRRALGESNSFIAKGLGKPPRYITEHLALADMPAPLATAYAAGKSTSPTTHYYLRNLYEKYPEQVEAWVGDQVEITRKSVEDLGSELAGKSDKAEREAAAPKASDFVRTKSDPDRLARTEESSPAAKVNFRPLLLVQIDGRRASVQLKQLPSRRGLLRIRYENDATEAEVEASRCTILSLEDGGKAVPLVGADAEAARATG